MGGFIVVVWFLMLSFFVFLFWTITGVWSLDVPLDYHWGLEPQLMLLWTITGVWSLDVAQDCRWGLES